MSSELELGRKIKLKDYKKNLCINTYIGRIVVFEEPKLQARSKCLPILMELF